MKRSPKRIIASVSAVIMLAASVPFASFAATSGTVTGSYVYVRSGAGTNYSVVGGCLKGTSVEVISTEGTWSKVKVGSIEGYMSSSYISLSNDTVYGTVTAKGVNLRTSPSTSSQVITVVKSGTQLPVLDTLDGWFKVVYNEKDAYISSDYFTLSEQKPDSQPDTSSPSNPPSVSSLSATGNVSYEIVNVRSGPGTTYPIIGKVKEGRSVTITAESGDWYRFDFNGSEGFISKTLVKLNSGVVIETSSEISGQGKVTGTIVNLRSGPGTSYSVVAQVSAGKEYPVSGETNGWYKIDYNGQNAYISSSYMTVSASTNKVTVGTVNVDAVNVRSGPGTDYSVLYSAKFGDSFTILSKSGLWYSVSNANGNKGYIKSTYLTTSVYNGNTTNPEPVEPSFTVKEMNATGTTIYDSLNIRSTPSTSSKILGSITAGQTVKVTGYTDGWYQVENGNIKGFVSEDYFRVSSNSYSGKPQETTATTKAETEPVTEPPAAETTSGSSTEPPPAETTASSTPAETTAKTTSETVSTSETTATEPPPIYSAKAAKQKEIVDYALSFIGIKYRYGGTAPDTGFDCSGFTQYVYKHFGYTINRVSQYTCGTKVDYKDLEPGDLVFFNTTGYGIGHVGLYIGDNQFVHAPCSGKKISITRMDTGYYYERFVCAVRII